MRVHVAYHPLALDQSDVWYAHGPDSVKCPDVASGVTTECDWDTSDAYPGTARKFWVHVPARYDPAQPACLAIFQDGWWYLDPDAQLRGAIVLNNLVDRGQIPGTIGVPITPEATARLGGRSWRAGPRQQRQDPTPPPAPRRHRQLNHHRALPRAHRPRPPHLPPPQTSRGQNQTRSHPLPQTPPRPPHLAPALHHQDNRPAPP